MRTRHFTLGIALLMLTGVVGVANAKTLHVHCTGSETFVDGVETNLDTDGDGHSAGVSQGIEICNIGRFFIVEESEFIHQPTLTTCPVGTTDEVHIDPTQGQHRGVATNEKTGDQLFFKTTLATLCGYFATFPFTFTSSAQFEIIGGTGKYAGATGTSKAHFTGSYLQFGFKGGAGGPFGGFAQFTFTSDSTLNLPNAGHGKED
jgi:hypothetical protein